jgi:hypothetical protein
LEKDGKGRKDYLPIYIMSICLLTDCILGASQGHWYLSGRKALNGASTIVEMVQILHLVSSGTSIIWDATG